MSSNSCVFLRIFCNILRLSNKRKLKIGLCSYYKSPDQPDVNIFPNQKKLMNRAFASCRTQLIGTCSDLLQRTFSVTIGNFPIKGHMTLKGYILSFIIL